MTRLRDTTMQILHVYVDTFDGLGYKFCLAVKFDKPFRDHHIAFTGMTGQGDRCRLQYFAALNCHRQWPMPTMCLR